MAYTEQFWQDGNPSYPLSAARMLHMEAGIAAATVEPGVLYFEQGEPVVVPNGTKIGTLIVQEA